jgi:hypothetical protein
MCMREEELRHEIDDINHQIMLATRSPFTARPGVVIKIIFFACICDGKTKNILSQRKQGTWDSDEFNGGDVDISTNLPAFGKASFSYKKLVQSYEAMQQYMEKCDEQFRTSNDRSYNDAERGRMEHHARIIFNCNCNWEPLFARKLPPRFDDLAGHRLDVDRLLWLPAIDHMCGFFFFLILVYRGFFISIIILNTLCYRMNYINHATIKLMLEIVLKFLPESASELAHHLKTAVSDLSIGRFNATFSRLVQLITTYVTECWIIILMYVCVCVGGGGG